MIPVRLSLKNFTSYGENNQPLDFTRFNLACLAGPNGAGKSSLLEAISYALWGEARGKSPDDLVRQGTRVMEVVFDFELEETTYRVIRSREFNRQTAFEFLALSPHQTNLTEATLKETQLKIDHLLRLSYETFINSSFLRQNRADEFTLKGPTDRKRILSDILGLSYYEELEEKAKKAREEMKAKISQLELWLSEAEIELTQSEEKEEELTKIKFEVKELEQKISSEEKLLKEFEMRQKELALLNNSFLQQKNLQTKITQELENLLTQLDNKGESLEEIKSLLSQKEKVEKEYGFYQKLKNEAEKLNQKQAQILALTRQKSELEKTTAALLEQNRKLREEMESLKIQIEKLKTGQKCPTCGQTITSIHKEEIVQKLASEGKAKKEQFLKNQQHEVFAKLEKLKEQIKSLTYDEERHQELNRRLTLGKGIEEKWQELKTAAETLKIESKNITELKLLKKNKETELKELGKNLKGLPQVLEKLQVVEKEIEEKESSMASLRQEEKEKGTLLGALSESVGRFKELAKQKVAKQKEKEELLTKKTVYEELVLAFGKKGVPAMIIEQVIPEIEEETNKLLEKLTDGRMRVSLLTQKGTKAGETVETLEIVISDELGARSYEMYSGGEAFRVNFALRLALSKLLTRRAGAKLQFLVVDEGFGTQDAQGRERLISAINAIQEDFAKILVVTHLEELKDAFPVRIEIEKGSDGSKYETIGA